jgi:hypothetical protein
MFTHRNKTSFETAHMNNEKLPIFTHPRKINKSLLLPLLSKQTYHLFDQCWVPSACESKSIESLSCIAYNIWLGLIFIVSFT